VCAGSRAKCGSAVVWWCSDVMLVEQVELSELLGDSEAQQAEILRIADRDAFNWGCARTFCPSPTECRSQADAATLQML